MEIFHANGLNWGLLFFTLTVASGFWLLKSGKPYKSGVFNIHKLIALGASVLYLFTLNLIRTSEGSGSNLITTFFILGCILVALLFGSGAMLSIGKPDHKAVLYAHRIGEGMAALAVIYIFYLRLTDAL
jgi:hypothetical protein